MLSQVIENLVTRGGHVIIDNDDPRVVLITMEYHGHRVTGSVSVEALADTDVLLLDIQADRLHGNLRRVTDLPEFPTPPPPA